MKDSTRSALLTAADKIGKSQYIQQLNSHLKKRKSRKTFRYAPTDKHNRLIQALNEDWPDDDAMGLLHEYDVLKQRIN